MKKILLLFKILVYLTFCIIGLLFGLSNSANVELNLLFYRFHPTTLGILLVIFLLAGFFLGTLVCVLSAAVKRLTSSLPSSEKSGNPSK